MKCFRLVLAVLIVLISASPMQGLDIDPDFDFSKATDLLKKSTLDQKLIDNSIVALTAISNKRFYDDAITRLLPRVTSSAGKTQPLIESVLNSPFIEPNSELAIGVISEKDEEEFRKKNYNGLADIYDSIEVRIFNEGDKTDLYKVVYTKNPKAGEQPLPTTSFAIPNFNPFLYEFNWLKVVDKRTIFSVTYQAVEKYKYLKSFFGRLDRPFYLEVAGVSGFYLTDYSRVLNVRLNDLNTLISTSNISFGAWLIKANFQSKILGLEKISIAGPMLYQIMDEPRLGLSAGLGVAVNFSLNNITIGIGYDLTNSSASNPIYQLLVGTDLASLLNVSTLGGN